MQNHEVPIKREGFVYMIYSTVLTNQSRPAIGISKLTLELLKPCLLLLVKKDIYIYIYIPYFSTTITLRSKEKATLEKFLENTHFNKCLLLFTLYSSCFEEVHVCIKKCIND